MNSRLWYLEPARRFEDAMPIGNGRLGAMIFGNPWNAEDYHSERIVLNEETLWYGGPTRRENPDAIATLARVRKLLLEGNIAEAEYIGDMGLSATPRNDSPYQPLGELVIASSRNHENLTSYRRELDMETGIATVAYEAGDTRYEFEYLASVHGNVLAFQVRCTGKEKLRFHAYLRRRPFDGEAFTSGEQTVGILGQAGPGGVRFAAAMTLRQEGGTAGILGQSLSVEGASSVTFYLASWSTFRKKNPRLACLETLRKASSAGFSAIKERHIEDHGALFKRVALRLGAERPIPTDKRLQRVRRGACDPALYALRFQFARYLLISSSRPGCLPLNLQGIWCGSMTPIWNCNYTLDVNLQMSYWPAETTALMECHLPLFDFLARLVKRGRQTAKRMYGCRGFVAHHTTDLWADTTPTGGVYASALWPFGGAWLALHAWEHFQFGRNLDFLKRTGYPILREAARFFEDYLVVNQKGECVAVPSVSPENFFALPGEGGGKGKLCAGAAMDSQILRELFDAAEQSAQLLNCDARERRLWRKLRDKLPPVKLASHGGIQEWEQGYSEWDPGHRHLSHLFALFPGSKISPLDASPFADAAATTIRRKLAHQHDCTGWSLSWMANHFARLLDGKSAHACLYEVLAKFTHSSLLGDCPPLNLDNNFGFCSAIAEMLLQSHRGELHLLPALPPDWPSGEITGLRARGGVTVSLVWKRGKLHRAAIVCESDCELLVRSSVEFRSAPSLQMRGCDDAGFLYTLTAKARQSYLISSRPVRTKNQV